jgi:hypothetical protein
MKKSLKITAIALTFIAVASPLLASAAMPASMAGRHTKSPEIPASQRYKAEGQAGQKSNIQKPKSMMVIQRDAVPTEAVQVEGEEAAAVESGINDAEVEATLNHDVNRQNKAPSIFKEYTDTSKPRIISNINQGEAKQSSIIKARRR